MGDEPLFSSKFKFQQKAPPAKLSDSQKSKFVDRLNVSQKNNFFKKNHVPREKAFRHWSHNIKYSS
jgi:hypothetical protein